MLGRGSTFTFALELLVSRRPLTLLLIAVLNFKSVALFQKHIRLVLFINEIILVFFQLLHSEALL